jgi:serine/threonine protein phosphatase PrpC
MDITSSYISKLGSLDVNEDAALCLKQDGEGCFVVADGLAGHGKGDVAAQKLIDVFSREFCATKESNTAFLARAFDTAQAEIIALQETSTEMRTTGVALSIANHRFAWGHVGDSRLYFFHKNKLKRRTIDHSVVQMLVIAGDISEADVARHPDRNKLLRTVGDLWEKPGYEISKEYRLSKSDSFLLCTDGFWEHIEESDILASLVNSAGADEWLGNMLSLVERNGAGAKMDDCTAITVMMR